MSPVIGTELKQDILAMSVDGVNADAEDLADFDV